MAVDDVRSPQSVGLPLRGNGHIMQPAVSLRCHLWRGHRGKCFLRELAVPWGQANAMSPATPHRMASREMLSA